MDVSGIGSQMNMVKPASYATPDVSKALSDMRQDKELEQFQIFVKSGETPEAERFQEDWMRPVENFML